MEANERLTILNLLIYLDLVIGANAIYTFIGMAIGGFIL